MSELAGFCQTYRVHKLSLFRSALRDDFNSKSDIDILVEFEPRAGISFSDLVTMEMELPELLGVRWI